MCKLLLCGYVELNQGSSTVDMLQMLRLGQQAIRSYLTEVKRKIHENCGFLLGSGDHARNNCQRHSTKKRIILSFNDSDEKIQQTFKLQQAIPTEFEDRSWRSNPVVFGVDERTNESEAKLRRRAIETGISHW